MFGFLILLPACSFKQIALEWFMERNAQKAPYPQKEDLDNEVSRKKVILEKKPMTINKCSMCS